MHFPRSFFTMAIFAWLVKRDSISLLAIPSLFSARKLKPITTPSHNHAQCSSTAFA